MALEQMTKEQILFNMCQLKVVCLQNYLKNKNESLFISATNKQFDLKNSIIPVLQQNTVSNLKASNYRNELFNSVLSPAHIFDQFNGSCRHV